MVSVRGDDEFLDAMTFYDQYGQVMLDIRGKTVIGVW